MKTIHGAAALALCLVLSGCGGGGGDDAPAALPDALSIDAPSDVGPGQPLALRTNAQAAAGLRYAWDFGDGSTSHEAAPAHAWALPGRYAVSVTVTRNDGAQQHVTMTVRVGHVANVAGLVCSQPADAGWCWQRPLPTGNPVNALTMLDAANGWAVGEQGTLLKTSDGGATWQPVAGPSTAALGDVAFADAQHGWALAADGSIWRTDDGGIRWQAVPLDVDDGAASAVNGGRLRVLSASRVLAGNGSTMVATEDGGLVWRRIGRVAEVVTPGGVLYATSGYNPGELLRSTDFGRSYSAVLSAATGLYWTYGTAAAFSDDLNGWFLATGYDSGYNAASSLWQTTDGGQTWRQPPGNVPSSYYGMQLRMFAGGGWLWAPGYGSIYRTTDGGAQWTPIQFPNGLWWLQWASPLDAATLLVGHYDGAWLTTDGGSSWKRVTPPEEDAWSGTAPAFERAGSVWLLRYGPRVYRSIDQGGTWARVLGSARSESFSALRSVWFTDARNGFAASDGGVLLRTSDGGRQWTPTEVKVAGRTSSGALQFVDSKTGWLLLGNDAFARSTDSGASWLVPATGTPPVGVTAFHFLDASHGWALGATDNGGVTGALWRTSDGGLNWDAAALPSTAYTAVALGDTGTGLLVGNNGRIARSTDGGATWTPVAAGVNQNFSRVRFTSPAEAWVVGSQGTLLHSTDAGASWRVVALPLQSDFNDVRFVDADHGWVVGTGGIVLATQDGGASWAIQASGTVRDLHSVHALDRSTAWIGGADGLVLATAFGGGR